MSEKGEPTNPYVTDGYAELKTGKQRDEILHDIPLNMVEVDTLRYEAQTKVLQRQHARLSNPDFQSKLWQNEDYANLTKEQRNAVLKSAMEQEKIDMAHAQAADVLQAKDPDVDENSLEFRERASMLGEMMSLDNKAFAELAEEPTIEKLKELTDKQAAERQELQDQIPRYYRKAEIPLDATDDHEEDTATAKPAPAAPKPPKPTSPAPKPQSQPQQAPQNSQAATKPEKGKQQGEPQQPEAAQQKFDLLEGLPFSWEDVAKTRLALEREARAKTNKLLNLPKPKNDKERAAQTAERSLYYLGTYKRAVEDYVEATLPYYGSGESKEAVNKKRDVLKLALRMDRNQFEENRREAAEAQTEKDTVNIVAIMNGTDTGEGIGTTTEPTTTENNDRNQSESGEKQGVKRHIGDFIFHREKDGSVVEAMVIAADDNMIRFRELTFHRNGVTERMREFGPELFDRIYKKMDEQTENGMNFQAQRFGLKRGFNFNTEFQGKRYNCMVIAFPHEVTGRPRLTLLDRGYYANGQPYERVHDVTGADEIRQFIEFANRTKQAEAAAQARTEAEQNRPQGNPAFEALPVPEPDLNDDERLALRQNPFLQRDRNGRLISPPRLLAGSGLEDYARQMLASRQFVRPTQNMVDAVMRDLQTANPQLVRAQNDRNPVVFTNQRVNLNWGSINYMEHNKQVPRIDHFIVQNNTSDFTGLARELLAMGGVSFEVKSKEAQEQLAAKTDRVVRALSGANNTPPYRYLAPGRINVTPDVWNLVDQIATGRQNSNGNQNRRTR